MTAKAKASNKKYKEVEAEIEDIRVTSVNIHEVVDRLLSLWLSLGIKVTLDRYPNNFVYAVSNTHYAPSGYPTNGRGEAGKPTGYPGWVGTWEGTVEVVNKNTIEKENINFTGLVNNPWQGTGLPNIPWIKTGTGSGGGSFRYSGMLFIYDFPAMNAEFEQNGGHFEVLQQEYCASVAQYRSAFTSLQKDHVNSRTAVRTCQDMVDQLKALLKDARGMRDKAIDHYKAEFAETYGAEVPKPSSVFVDDRLMESTILLKNYNRTTKLPELVSAKAYVQQISDAIDSYKEEHPEVFI